MVGVGVMVKEDGIVAATKNDTMCVVIFEEKQKRSSLFERRTGAAAPKGIKAR
jgi:hypothetical protein